MGRMGIIRAIGCTIEGRAELAVAPYATLGAYGSCRDRLGAGSDESGLQGHAIRLGARGTVQLALQYLFRRLPRTELDIDLNPGYPSPGDSE